jgi:phytoene dehydrogenase-like protein
LNIELRRRATASFTPYELSGHQNGLLLSNVSEEQNIRSMTELTGSAKEYEQMKRFYNLARVFAEETWDSMLEPLQSRRHFARKFQRKEVGQEAWRSLAEEPIGMAIERYLHNDLVRGLVLTDAKIGIFTHAHDPSLVQNRCFLYHLIGNKTGEWKVPVGGMGAVAGELERAARKAGGEILTDVRISALHLDGKEPAVEFSVDGKKEKVGARFLLVNFGPNILSSLTRIPFVPERADEGSVFKINILLRGLPRLKSEHHRPEEAFCGTFHSDEGYEQMDRSYGEAAHGRLPDRPPCEVYCHTLTDTSILSRELQEKGFQTLTLFGIDTPWSLFSADNDTVRREAEEKFVRSLDQWLAEPLSECIALDRAGRPCIESKSPVDIEEALGMYHGNIFQNAPSFPFATDERQVGTWGVETEFPNVFMCGSSACRGGAVSGIPGHNAARKIFDVLGIDR